jgi:heme-degrading monooxygenase HmoA
MSQHSDPEMMTIEEVTCNSEGWRPTLESNGYSGFRTLNARAVELIAKPGKIRDLRNCIRERVVEYLKVQDGFSSAVVLTSHKEPRLILILTFWNTEKEATGSRWEKAPAVRKMLSSLIDVCSKVQTYEAAVPKLPGVGLREMEIPVC